MRAERSRPVQLGEVDLTLYMNPSKLRKLSKQDKEKLRNIVRKDHRQKHFIDSSAASGASDEVVAVLQREEIIRINRARSELWPAVYEWAQPIPKAKEFVEGIGHYNSEPQYNDVKFIVPRTIASTQMHYYTRMIPKLTDTPEPLFNSLYPHLNTASGVQPLTWLRIKSELKVESEVRYVLHLLP